MSWQHQKELQENPIPTVEEMKGIIWGISNVKHRALLTLCYLTAGRITEVLALKRENITRDIVNGRTILLFKNLPNRKNRRRKFKDIPVPLDKEGDFYEMMAPYIDSKIAEMKLFTFSRQRGWQILQKYGYNPHFIRHIRLTHLVTRYDFNEFLLSRYAGWTDSRPAKHYMEIRWRDILQKM